MTKLSVVVITRNEEKNLRRCLESVRWADDIVVVDNRSEDGTVAIAHEFGARVFSPEWKGYGPAKRHGVEQAAFDWVLSLDADEQASDELSAEVRAAIACENGTVGYYIPRLTWFLGRWIRHCGWYPDLVLRLFRKSHGNFNESVVHEMVVVNGPTACLTHDILHHSYPDLEHYLAKSNNYTSIGAQEAFRRGRRAGWADIILRPPVAFLKHYVVRGGFRDGLEGFLVSYYSSTAVAAKYTKLRQLARREQNRKE